MWGLRHIHTGRWCENATFATREEAERFLSAQYHKAWIEQYEVAFVENLPATAGAVDK